MGTEPNEGLEVLRGVWDAQGQSGADLDDCGNTKACKRMSAVGFDGLAAEADGDLRAAWKAKLEREGKLNVSGGSIRDLVLGHAPSPADGGDSTARRTSGWTSRRPSPN
jgi:hypothetical protein